MADLDERLPWDDGTVKEKPRVPRDGKHLSWHKKGWHGRCVRNSAMFINRPEPSTQAVPGEYEALQTGIYIASGHPIAVAPARTHVHTHATSVTQPMIGVNRTYLSKTVHMGDVQVIYNTDAQYQELSSQLHRMQAAATAVQAKSMNHKQQVFTKAMDAEKPTTVHTRREVNRSPDVQMKYWAASMRQLDELLRHSCPPTATSHAVDAAAAVRHAALASIR